MIQESLTMFNWDLKREWKEKNSIGSMLIFLLSTLMVVYFALGTQLRPGIWTALYWIVLLFGISGIVLRSFASESKAKMLGIYTMIHPNAFILARILFNSLNSIILSVLAAFFFLFFYQLEIASPGIFILASLLGSLTMTSLLTFITALSYRAKNPHILSVILAFPISIPILLSAIKLSLSATGQVGMVSSLNLVSVLLALLVLVVVLSLLLFPYLWRD